MRLWFSRFAHFPPRLLDALWLAALCGYIMAGTPLVPFHGDESTIITMSRDYAYQFIDHDMDMVTYHDPPINGAEQNLRLLNGTVSKYLIGLSWHLAGYSVDDLNEQWDWGADWHYNVTTGHMPSTGLLQVSRIIPAAMLAISAIAMFGIGTAAGGRGVAYAASLYVALNPGLLIDGRRAMFEGSLTLFSLLTVLAGLWFARRRSWRAALALGMASGLAIASKHTGALTAAAVFLACGAYPATAAIRAWGDREKWRQVGRTAMKLAAAGLLMLMVFYVLNPAWWGAPVERLRQVLTMRQTMLAGQADTFGGYQGFGDQTAGFFSEVFVALPQYYEVPEWQSYIGDQIARYEASPWHGISLGGSVPGGLVLLGLTILGGWWLLRDRRIDAGTRWVVGLWAAIMLLSTWLLTPLEWERYYLPAYPAVGLLGGIGLITLARRAWRIRTGTRNERYDLHE